MALSKCGPVWFLDKAAIVVDHPTKIEFQEERLHCVGGPAIEYKDGTKVWALTGIRVEQWIAEEDASDWTSEKVLGIENVDQRREAVKRFGIDRLMDKATTLDTEKNEEGQAVYELLKIDITGMERRYLKMINPSIGCFHVEGVDNGCETVQDCINFRNGLTPDMIDDEEGVEYYQQGDVLFLPKGAKKFKSRPTKLT